jgi:hypothetical protein
MAKYCNIGSLTFINPEQVSSITEKTKDSFRDGKSFEVTKVTITMVNGIVHESGYGLNTTINILEACHDGNPRMAFESDNLETATTLPKEQTNV